MAAFAKRSWSFVVVQASEAFRPPSQRRMIPLLRAQPHPKQRHGAWVLSETYTISNLLGGSCAPRVLGKKHALARDIVVQGFISLAFGVKRSERLLIMLRHPAVLVFGEALL
eukprot:6243224-Pyramimonas_sp.AAC.1